MSRAFKPDMDELVEFIRTFSMSSLCEEPKFVTFLSTLHKKFYAYLTLSEEMRKCQDNPTKQPLLVAEQTAFIQESVSDCGQCLFLCINGCYKGARLLLRSSIENFLKGTCMDEISQIVTEKSVYQVFDDAELSDVFKKETILLNQLHDIYSQLCADVHTADQNHMAGVTALQFFPRFVEEEAGKIKGVYIKLLPIFITVLCIKYRMIFHSIEWKNKEIIASSHIDKYKPAIYGEKS